MFYKPTFCCHCGERISRAERSLADSSRFCDVCKHDFLGLRLAPMIFSAFMLLLGLAGTGGLMRASPPVQIPTRSAPVAAMPVGTPKEPVRNTAVNAPLQVPNPNGANVARPLSRLQPATPLIAEEPLSMCGAPTKKGTPCSRKVRGRVRCWQHVGLADAPKAEKSPGSR
jgi:hypothetical protein